MHELSIALSIIDRATESHSQLDLSSDRRVVTAIHIRLGTLCGVVKEALVSAFELARVGSPLPRAELVIEEVPLTAYCPKCGTTRTVVSNQQHQCNTCGTPTPCLVTGREMEIVALEVEEP